MLSTYQGYMLYTRDPGKAYQRAAAQPLNARDEDYYRENIGKVRKIDDFLNDFRLFGYAMKAYNLEDMTYAKAFMKKVLLSDLSDEKSFANRLNDTRYRSFAEAFQFDPAGNVIDTATAQSTEQGFDTLNRFKAAAGSSVAATIEYAYLVKKLPAVDSVDDLIKDKRLLSDVLAAYKLNSGIDPKVVSSALKSDLSDPASYVNRTGNAALKELVADFNFDADGNVATARIAQTQESFSRMARLYLQAIGTDPEARKTAGTESKHVWEVISTAPSIDMLVADKRTVAYIGTAFGDPKIDATKLRAILTSDLDDPRSTANTLGPKFHDMAASFQFTPAGMIARELNVTAQSRTDIELATQSYLQNSMEADAGRDNVGVKLALYFARKASELTSAYDFLADKALLKFVQTALQLPASGGANVDVLAKSIEKRLDLADLKDPAKVNKLVARFAALYDMQNGVNSQSLVLQLFGGGNAG